MYDLWPGSMAAIARGCRCPVLDNGRGSVEHAKMRGGFWVSGDCPLHGFEASSPYPYEDFVREDEESSSENTGSTGA